MHSTIWKMRFVPRRVTASLTVLILRDQPKYAELASCRMLAVKPGSCSIARASLSKLTSGLFRYLRIWITTDGSDGTFLICLRMVSLSVMVPVPHRGRPGRVQFTAT